MCILIDAVLYKFLNPVRVKQKNMDRIILDGIILDRIIISEQQFDEERALYHLPQSDGSNCVSAGPVNGESALKTRGIHIVDMVDSAAVHTRLHSLRGKPAAVPRLQL